jgi:hypothetical protein
MKSPSAVQALTVLTAPPLPPIWVGRMIETGGNFWLRKTVGSGMIRLVWKSSPPKGMGVPHHRFLKRRVKPGMVFFPLQTAWRTLQGYEIMNMMRKGQAQGVEKGDTVGQRVWVAKIFGVAASMQREGRSMLILFSSSFLQHNRKRASSASITWYIVLLLTLSLP